MIAKTSNPEKVLYSIHLTRTNWFFPRPKCPWPFLRTSLKPLPRPSVRHLEIKPNWNRFIPSFIKENQIYCANWNWVKKKKWIFWVWVIAYESLDYEIRIELSRKLISILGRLAFEAGIQDEVDEVLSNVKDELWRHQDDSSSVNNRYFCLSLNCINKLNI